MELLPRPGQPAPQGRHGPSQPPGGLLVAQALQVAEDHRQPVLLRQPVDLLVHDARDVGIGPGVGHGHGRHRRCLRLAAAPPPRLDARLHGRAIRHAVQPAAQGVAGADRAGLPGQDQEGGLEGVLDVLLVPQHGAAGRQDHRAVPRHQGLEGRLVAGGGVSGQQLAVTQADGRAVVEQVAEVPQGPSYCQAARHCRRSPRGSLSLAGRRSPGHRIDRRSLQGKRGAGGVASHFSRLPGRY